jgi:hypothetical protein
LARLKTLAFRTWKLSQWIVRFGQSLKAFWAFKANKTPETRISGRVSASNDFSVRRADETTARVHELPPKSSGGTIIFLFG